MSNNLSENKLTRLCHVIKRDDFDGYGFNLHAEKGKPGQYIGKVDDNSPAEIAGLKQGDRIIEVNGVNIGNETHKQVVQRIKAIACEVRLLVVDPMLVPVSNNNKIVESDAIGGDVSGEPTDAATVTATSDNDTEMAATELSICSSQNDSPMATTNGGSGDSNGQASITMPTMIDNHKNSNDENDSLQNNVPLTSVNMYNSSSQVNSKSSPEKVAQPHQQARESGGGGSEGLNLKMTAAELRAKLAAKKKYDPKTDTVDLRKKYEIVQKL